MAQVVRVLHYRSERWPCLNSIDLSATCSMMEHTAFVSKTY